MKPIIILVRAEGDFERAISIGIEAKKKHKVFFIYAGDNSPFFKDGIKNVFQKKLFAKNNFKISDFSDFDFISKILKSIVSEKNLTFKQSLKNPKFLFRYLVLILLKKYLTIFKIKIDKKIFKKINPKILFTDISTTQPDYLPEIFRKRANLLDIDVYIFTHGAASALHLPFNPIVFNEYKNSHVLACNKFENYQNYNNRILLGDMASSKFYVDFLSKQNYEEIDFHNERKYKIGFIVGGIIFTSTNGWEIQKQIIVDLSEREDVAMVLKTHPRDLNFIDFRFLNQFKNLKIVGSETDRSRVSKWSDIVICNDHCSAIFEPMILGKKVVAIEGKHLPKYKNVHSPIKNSSVTHISSSSQFDIDDIPNANAFDKVTDEIAWGSNGPINLSKFLFEKIID